MLGIAGSSLFGEIFQPFNATTTRLGKDCDFFVFFFMANDTSNFSFDISYAASGSHVVLQDHVSSVSSPSNISEFSSRLRPKTSDSSEIDGELQVPFSEIDCVSSRLAFESDINFSQRQLLPQQRGKILRPADVDEAKVLIFNCVMKVNTTTLAKQAICNLHNELRSLDGRLRLQAYVIIPDMALEEVIEIVPSQSLLQVSTQQLIELGFDKAFESNGIILVATVLWSSLLGMWVLANVSDADSLRKGSQAVLVCFAISFAIYLPHLSRGLLKCLFLTFEAWMHLVWIAVGTAIHMSFWGANLKVPLSFSYALANCIALLTDASLTLPLRTKGAVQLLNTTLNLLIFLTWSVRNHSVGRFTGTINTAVIGIEVPLIIIGQFATLSLSMYHARLAYRYLMQGNELALVDFCVRSVEYLKTEATTNSGKLLPQSILVHAQGSLPWPERRGRDQLIGMLDARVMKHGELVNSSVISSDMYSEDRRSFQPSMFLMLFSPEPLVRSLWVDRFMRSKYFPVFFAISGGLTIFVLEVFLSKSTDAVAAQVFLRLLWITVFSAHLACGVSVAMVRHVLRTMDFWVFIAAFFCRNLSSMYVYSSTAPTVVTVAHMTLVTVASFSIAHLDCITAPCFTSLIKGALGSAAAAYEIFDCVYKFPKHVEQNPSLYKVFFDLGFTTLDFQSLSETAGIVLTLYFLKIFARSVLMRSSKVFIQIPAIGERKS
jgi:hypothetical protein